MAVGVTRLPARLPLAALLDDFTVRYRKREDRLRAKRIVRGPFAHAKKTHPSELTGSDVLRWVNDQQELANNTLRSYTAMARTFMGWAAKQGHCDHLDLDDETQILRRSYPKTSGKVQGRFPARRLSYDEAYGALLDACRDGSWRGSRDQLAFRIGLLGIRVTEVTDMNWGHLSDGTLDWIGKGRKPRTVKPGPTLVDLLARWKRQYERQLERPVRNDDPILCRIDAHGNVLWGRRLGGWGYRDALLARATAAGLGHVAPHDLRRTAAKLLHDAKTSDGAHRFDLRDIQQVLGHARAETTTQYLDALDTDAIDRAASVLD